MGLSQSHKNAAKFSVWQYWAVPLGVSVVAILIAFAGDEGRAVLRFDRDGLANGQLWRLITGHLAHLGGAHTALNLAGLALTWVLIGRALTPIGWLLAGLTIMLVIDAGLWWMAPTLNWYVGLSGLLHGWLALGAVEGIRRREALGWVLLIGLATKIVFEQWLGPLPGSEVASWGPVVIDAHAFGALGGVIAAFLVAKSFGGTDIMRADNRRPSPDASTE